MISLKEQIKAAALSLGFLDCAFSPIFPVPGFEKHKKWIEEGKYADMDYLASSYSMERKADPRLLLPSCKTVISLVSAYPPPTASGKKGYGKIAAYAVHRDYHDMLYERLKKFVALIEGLTEEKLESDACVDTSVILEKNYAQKAGLGWIGRNSLLLHPKFGSWINLSELLVNFEIEESRPCLEDGCDDCFRCVRACPTQAILPNRTLDARRCLSYLTIENRGEIPLEFREAMGNRIFGCDQCQTVCPVNKKAKLTSAKPLLEEEQSLEESLLISASDFKVKYRYKPIWRATHSGFRRNVAIAIGNSGDSSFLPLLEEVLESESDPMVIDAIVWARDTLAGYWDI